MTPDPWRLRCPDGHCSWTSRGAEYYCEVCDQYFARLVDAKHDRPVESPQLC